MTRLSRPLVISGCRRECSWHSTGDRLGSDDGSQPLFACSSCGSEWVPSEPWTPIDWQGEVPPAVSEAVREAAQSRRGRGRG